MPTTTIRHEWKSKHDSKRSRQGSRAPERDLLKSIRLQNKLENKLEKIERKTLKLQEKNMVIAAAAAARSSDSDVGRSSGRDKSRRIGIQLEDLEMHFLDAKPVKNPVTIVPHMVGGEVYLQEWEVINSGDICWDSNTDFRFAWGHESLVPISRAVPVPKLKPGEQGTVSVALELPNAPGQYESYWHFYHKDRRFGCWLGCQIIVDPFPVPSCTEVDLLLQTSFATSSPLPNPFEDHFAPEAAATTTTGQSPKPLNTDEVIEEMKNLSLDGDREQEPKTQADDTNCSSDSDNQSIISVADSNTSIFSGSSSDEFVVLSAAEKETSVEVDVEAIDEETEQKNEGGGVEPAAEEGEEAATAAGNDDNINNNDDGGEKDLTEKSPEIVSKSGYAYVTLHGRKLAVPKCFLHDEYLATAEDAPDPTKPEPEPEATSAGAIPKATEATTTVIPTTPIETPLLCSSKSVAETKPTFSKGFGRLTQSCAPATAAAATAADNSNDSFCSATGTAVPGFEVVSLATTNNTDHSVFDRDGEINGKTNEDCFIPHYSFYSTPPPLPPVGATAPPAWVNPMSASNSYRLPTPSYYDQFALPYDDYPLVYSNFPVTTEVYQPIPVSAPMHLPPPIQPPRTANRQNTTQSKKVEVKMVPLQQLQQQQQQQQQQMHILPENLRNSAANVASSAINTAKSVLQMMTPNKTEEPGRWVNGHWVATQPESAREAALRTLTDMGFTDRDYNASLLNRYNDNIEQVIADLLATK